MKKQPDEAHNNILFGEEQVHYLPQKFRLSERETPNEIPGKSDVYSMCCTAWLFISSSEFEKSFSQLN